MCTQAGRTLRCREALEGERFSRCAGFVSVRHPSACASKQDEHSVAERVLKESVSLSVQAFSRSATQARVHTNKTNTPLHRGSRGRAFLSRCAGFVSVRHPSACAPKQDEHSALQRGSRGRAFSRCAGFVSVRYPKHVCTQARRTLRRRSSRRRAFHLVCRLSPGPPPKRVCIQTRRILRCTEALEGERFSRGVQALSQSVTQARVHPSRTNTPLQRGSRGRAFLSVCRLCLSPLPQARVHPSKTNTPAQRLSRESVSLAVCRLCLGPPPKHVCSGLQ